jgi:hypothetical protein
MAAEHRFEVVLIGRFARDMLLGNAELRVAAAFDRSCYVGPTRGMSNAPMPVACIGPMPLGPGPLNGLCCEPPEWRGRGIEIGDRIEVVATAHAELWMPPPSATRDRWAVAVGLERLAAACERTMARTGFAALIAPLARGATLVGISGLERTALPCIEALRSWLRGDVVEPPLAEPLPLIGLGPGLTPSGDDLVGGLLIVLQALRWSARAVPLGRRALHAAEHGTNVISYAHLLAASRGEGAAILHEAIERLFAGDAVDLTAVARLGQSSGWDMLAGVALGARGWLDAGCTNQREPVEAADYNRD